MFSIFSDRRILLVAAFMVFPITHANGALLIYEATVTLDLASGTDTLDLEDAILVYRATFDDSTVYQDSGGLPMADAISHSLTITGSSVTSGVFVDPDGAQFVASAPFPTNLLGQHFDGTGAELIFDLGANGLLAFLSGISDASTPGAIFPGDPIQPTDFMLGSTGAIGTLFMSDEDNGVGLDNNYNLASFSATATTQQVPEPGSMILLGTVGAFGVCRRLRGRRKHQRPV